MKPYVSLLLFCLAISAGGNAQLLNKLKQKAASVAGASSLPSQNNPSSNSETQQSSSQSPTIQNMNTDYPFIVLSDVKFYFSDQPFTNSHSGAKTTFNSQDFIYGRLELNSKSISEAFKLEAQPSKNFHYLNYGILITPKGKNANELNYNQTVKYTVYNSSRPILIRTEEEKNTWFNFDILPDPVHLTTLEGSSDLPENINEFKFAAGMDLLTRENSIRQHFPENGDYTVQLVIWNYAFDDWGKPLESEKNIVALGAFDYQFNAKDGATLIGNSQKRLDGVLLAQAMKNKYTKLPDWWNGKPFTPADAVLKPATITAMIKNYCANNGLTYINHKIYPGSTSGWSIATDSQSGFPVSRRSNIEAWTLYKDEQGRCRFAVALIDEKYAGAGTFGSPYINGLSGEFIDCSAIK